MTDESKPAPTTPYPNDRVVKTIVVHDGLLGVANPVTLLLIADGSVRWERNV